MQKSRHIYFDVTAPATYMARGVEETSTWTTAKIAAIRKFAAETAEFAGLFTQSSWRF